MEPPQQAMRDGPPGVKFSVDLSSPWRPEDEVLESFEFDHELTRRFWADQKKCQLCLFCWWFPPALVELWCLSANMADMAYGRWLAVSKDNVFVVRKKRKSGYRFDCEDVGTIRKMIPVANVQDVLIQEPAGASVCCCVPEVLTSVQLQTAAASSPAAEGGGSPHTDASMACLVGLQDPKRFRDVILGLKRGVYIDEKGDRHTVPVTAVDAVGAPLTGASPSSGAATAPTPAMQATLDKILHTLESIDHKMDALPSKCSVPGAAKK